MDSENQADHRGSAIARIAGQNVRKHSDQFEERVPVWVFEEMVSFAWGGYLGEGRCRSSAAIGGSDSMRHCAEL